MIWVWLIIWLLSGAPHVDEFPYLTGGWIVSLAIVLIIEAFNR